MRIGGLSRVPSGLRDAGVRLRRDRQRRQTRAVVTACAATAEILIAPLCVILSEGSVGAGAKNLAPITARCSWS